MGDENIKYVPEGVFLVCDKGDIPTQLICDPDPINLYSVKYADENDRKPILNVQPFGTCKVLGGPCVPPLLTWTKLKEDVRLHGFKPLLETSECICAAGGKITIFLDEYAAYLAAENNSESDFVSESISSNILGFVGLGPLAPALEMLAPGITEGVGRGIKKGAEGTWNFLTHDMWQADTWKGLGRMAVVAGVYGMNANQPAGSIQSDMMLRSLDNRFGTSFVQTRDGLATGIERGVTHAIEDVRRGNWGEVGESIGQIEYAVAEAVVGSKGAGLAVKGATAATRLAIGAERLAQLAAAASRVMERLKSVTGIVRIGTAVRRITPASLGIRMLADNPELLRIWNQTLRDLAASRRSNMYRRYLDNLANGTPMTNEFLADTFGYVRQRFKANAEAAGHTINGEIHHWNYPKSNYPDQIVNPRNLTEPVDRATHQAIHEATSGGTNMWEGPISPNHELPVNEHPLPR